MKKIILSLFSFLFVATLLAQKKNITLNDIWATGTFQTKRMHNLTALKKSNQYSVLNYDNQTKTQQIDLHNFNNLEKIKTIFSTKNTQISQIDDYSFSDNEKKIVIATNSEPIYRHSFVADYFVYDIDNQSLTKFTEKKIQEPLFSPDASKIAFVFENNIYIYDFLTKKEMQVTFDGAKNRIINGVTDWVYEEEFSFVRAFEWNSNGEKIAFLKFDESQVPQFSMDMYGETLYPTQAVFKYPKAGEKNAVVSLHLYDIKKLQLIDFQLDAYYIPRLKWATNPDLLSVQTLNRHQNDFNLVFVNTKNNETKSVLNEKSKSYVEITDNLLFLNDDSFLLTSEKSGFNHIYHYEKSGKLKNQLTSGNWEVTAFYGFDPVGQTIFYQSTENGSINRGVYSVALNGKNKKALSAEKGMNNATFSPDFSVYINQFSSASKPSTYTLCKAKSGEFLKEILNNDAVSKKMLEYNIPTKEFFEIETKNGKFNAYIIKPTNFNPNKKYPLLFYQYSGPGSQEVKNQWHTSNDLWHFLLAENQYVIVCVDGRGTGFKGADFKKCTYKQLGKFEVEDQTQVAKIFSNYPYIDKNRIGIWGWSFGGFMSSNCLFQSGDVFKTAVAVAPVTNWRFYDTIYTERFMQTPQENALGYDVNSPLNHAEKLKGNYLLIHGTADDNVHIQNAMVLINKLVSLNKNFDWLIYPDKNHGIYGGYTRLQLYTKMTDYILKNL